jgi:hypothetical protein
MSASIPPVNPGIALSSAGDLRAKPWSPSSAAGACPLNKPSRPLSDGLVNPTLLVLDSNGKEIGR